MSEVLIRVLGPVEIECDGDVVVTRSRSRRRVLACLAAHRREVVSLDQLVEITGSPASAVRTTVCRLRKTVGDGVILTNSSGYSIEPGRCDATIVEALLSEARGSRPGRALQCIDAALAYRRGPTFGSFAGEPWALADATRLDELLTAAVEDCADLLMEMNRHEEAIALLRSHIVEHPLRDRPRRSLMMALQHTGRVTEALRHFQSYRQRLVEFGTEPPEATAALERRIATGSNAG